jgi:hypothetical protein
MESRLLPRIFLPRSREDAKECKDAALWDLGYGRNQRLVRFRAIADNPTHMPIVHDEDDEFENGHRDPEDPDPGDMDDDYDTGRTDTIECPYCDKEIVEDSPWCPHCGNYLSKEDAPASRKPVWIVVGVVVLILALLAWLLRT